MGKASARTASANNLKRMPDRDLRVAEHLHTYTDPNGTAVGPDGQEVVPTRRTNSGTETPIKSHQEVAEEEAKKEQKDEAAPAASRGLEE